MTQLNSRRVWIDGCFDFTHHGHSGAILQARRTIEPGPPSDDWLICGVHSDEDINFNKGGMPVMNEQERYAHTRSNRWCDEVVTNAPYVTEPDVLDSYQCKYVVHGDDITTDANGQDCYQIMKDMGRFKVVKRTDGVSTTDIIHRILINEYSKEDTLDILAAEKFATGRDGYQPFCWVFHRDFGLDNALVKGLHSSKSWLVVEEEFDLFHMGHIEKLALLRQQYPNQRILCSIKSGHSYMSLNERCLTVLSSRYVDGIIIHRDPLNCPVHVQLSTYLAGHPTQFQYLDKSVIIDRIYNSKDHYVERNVKKGIDRSVYETGV